MTSVSKRLATDETLMLLVDAVNNTETVKQAKAEIQAEGTAQVNNVKSTAEEMVKDINQVPKNTSDIAELNSNLVDLKVGENGCGKNHFNKNNVSSGYLNGSGYIIDNAMFSASDYIYVEGVPAITISGNSGSNEIICFFDTNKNIINSISVGQSTIKPITVPNNATFVRCTVKNTNLDVYQLEFGDIATDYEPYIPSVKMLAKKTTQIDDLNVLGWVVPEEMPIKNYTDSDGVFHQIVGRVDLGTLNWTYDVPNTQFYTDIISQIKQDEIWIYDVYCSKYITASYGDKRIALNGGRIYIGDSSYTDGDSLKHNLRGVYLYFELSTSITMNIDGNEAVTKIKNDLSGNDKVVIPLLNSCTGDLYYHKIGDLIVVNGVVNIPKANENVKVAVLPNSKVNQANAFTIYNFTDDTHDSEYATRYASDSSLVVKVPIANKDYIISGCYIGN